MNRIECRRGCQASDLLLLALGMLALLLLPLACQPASAIALDSMRYAILHCAHEFPQGPIR
jgi:hypothetical protein